MKLPIKLPYGETQKAFNQFRTDFYKYELPRLKKVCQIKNIVPPIQVKKGTFNRQYFPTN